MSVLLEHQTLQEGRQVCAGLTVQTQPGTAGSCPGSSAWQVGEEMPRGPHRASPVLTPRFTTGMAASAPRKPRFLCGEGQRRAPQQTGLDAKGNALPPRQTFTRLFCAPALPMGSGLACAGRLRIRDPPFPSLTTSYLLWREHPWAREWELDRACVICVSACVVSFHEDQWDGNVPL